MRADSLAFAAMVIQKHDEVTEIEIVPPHTLVIHSKSHPPVRALIVSERNVSDEKLIPIVTEHKDHNFIANIPKKSIWLGDAIVLAEMHGMGWGGLGTLMAAVADGDADTAQPKEYRFAQRLLEQHKNVDIVHRVYDEVFRLERKQGEDLIVTLLNDYEMTADNVRTQYETYGHFNLIYKTNPNGRPTAEAQSAAESLGLEIHNSKGMMQRLHR